MFKHGNTCQTISPHGQTLQLATWRELRLLATLIYLQGEIASGFAKSPMVSAKAAVHILPLRCCGLRGTSFEIQWSIWVGLVATTYIIYTYTLKGRIIHHQSQI